MRTLVLYTKAATIQAGTGSPTGTALHEIIGVRPQAQGETLVVPAPLPSTTSAKIFNVKGKDRAVVAPGNLVDPQLTGRFVKRVFSLEEHVLASLAPAFIQWHQQVKEFEGLVLPADHAKASTFLYQGAAGVWLTLVANHTDHPDWCIKYIGQVARGAADTTNATQFFTRTAAQTSAPTSPISWGTTSTDANPTRLNLSAAVAVPGTPPEYPFAFSALSALLA